MRDMRDMRALLILLVLLGDAIGFKFTRFGTRATHTHPGHPGHRITDLSLSLSVTDVGRSGMKLSKDERELQDMKYSSYDGNRIQAYYKRHPLGTEYCMLI
jgi:hypothetical protein